MDNRIQNDFSFKEIPLKKAVEETEKHVLLYALSKYKTTRKMAKALGVNQTTIMRKLRKYKLKLYGTS
ncbi:TyrR/PhhR family helix-turn-helix DNA-binding protein [Aeribacillus composti]